ncbi:MAG TPA: glycosyltransferase [Planctomycetota bacterium]|nr:glycosyltransferase [Planctomycetota bacterium]
MKTITLCTIVRNEADNLPGLLASVQGIVDQVVVVDTGSDDNTVEIARQAGAHVVHHVWKDDFAAARNAGVAEVEGGFVLILDADERLAPGAGEALRQAVASDRIDGGRLPLYNASRADASIEEVLSGSKRLGPPIHLERFLRRTPDLRWQGVVHEHITDWARDGKRFANLDAAIIHYGATEEVRTDRGKAERNLRLLELAVQREPKNAVYKTYLAQDLIQAGQTERAREQVEGAWALIADLKAQRKAAPDPTPAATLRVVLLLQESKFDLAASTIQQALRWTKEHPNLVFLGGLVHERRWLETQGADHRSARLESAAKAYERCATLGDKPTSTPALPGATSWAAATRLGTVRLLQAKPDQAEVAFERALASKPRHIEALLGLAECQILRGLAAQALSALSPLLHTELADGWILAAWAGFQFGGYQEVAPMVEQARRVLTTRECLATHRLWILEELEAEGKKRSIA